MGLIGLVVVLALSLTAIPLVCEGQPIGSPRVGYLGNGKSNAQAEAFRWGLRELGWVEGQTVTIEYRWAEGNPDRLPVLFSELVQAKVNVIVLSGPTAIRAANEAKSAIPIVFVSLADPVTSGYVPSLARPRARLAELAARYRLPAVYELRNHVEDGGLMSYGPSIDEMFHRTASYVDRILKGAKPGDLPIERPTKFELVINLRTAKALGLTIPQSVLLRADQVIQ